MTYCKFLLLFLVLILCGCSAGWEQGGYFIRRNKVFYAMCGKTNWAGVGAEIGVDF